MPQISSRQVTRKTLQNRDVPRSFTTHNNRGVHIRQGQSLVTKHPGLCIVVYRLSDVAFGTQFLGISQSNVWRLTHWKQSLLLINIDKWQLLLFSLQTREDHTVDCSKMLHTWARWALRHESWSLTNSRHSSVVRPTLYSYCVSSCDFVQSVILIFSSVNVTDVHCSVEITWLWIVNNKYITYMHSSEIQTLYPTQVSVRSLR